MLQRRKFFSLSLLLLLSTSMLLFLPDIPVSEATHEVSCAQVSSDEDSRWQTITVVVEDHDGNPLPGAEVSYEQKDLDFIYSASGSAFIAWMVETETGWERAPYADDEIEKYNSLGVNNVEYYPWWLWLDAEPEDNEWNLLDDGQFTDPEHFRMDFPNVRFNTFWVGPQFNVPSFVPPWIDYEDMDEFKNEFADYITAAFNLNPTKHFDLYELCVEINDWPVWGKGAWDITNEEWQEAIEFIKWEAELIKQLDPDAKISVDFDPVVYFPDVPACHMTNWIDKLIEAEVDFDVIGLEIHPASFPGDPNNIQELKALLDSLEHYDKEIYIWEFGVRSEGVPEIPLESQDWVAPVSEYSEEFQENLMLESFQVFIENPRVIGVRYLVYKDPSGPGEPEWHSSGGKGYGLLREDRTPKPAYYAVRDYWHNLFTSGEATTDSNGEVTFQGIAGIYEVTVQKEGYKTVEETIHAVKGEENVFTFSLEALPTEEPTCIIATTTYGSELAPEVQFLRGFRDSIVQSTFAGGQFMRVFNAWYYSFSPTVAGFIASHPVVKTVMRGILYPLVRILRLSSMVYSVFAFCPELGVVVVGLVASSLIGVVYFTLPATMLLAVVKRLRKKTLKTKQLKLLTITWLISLALMLLGEVTFSPAIMMAATTSFVLTTLSSSATIIASKIIQRFP